MMKDSNKKTWWQTVNSVEDAEIIMYGIPYDATASFQKGTVEGPQEFRDNLEFSAETWSPYQNKELKELKIFDAGDVPLTNVESSTDMTKQVYEFAKKYAHKKTFMIGGEHSITYPVFKAASEQHKDLHIIQFDAHTDLRDDFYGDPYSHACIMKKCIDEVGPGKAFQFGIRSGIKHEFEMHDKGITYIEKAGVSTLSKIVEQIKDKPVYVTIDIDVFDPSLVPGTGTPEGGGITFKEMLSSIEELKKIHNIVGFDIVELSPKLDYSKRSTAIAIQTAREMLTALW